MKRRKLIIILLIIMMLASLMYFNEKYRPFEAGRYDETVLQLRLLNWNLRELSGYPQYQIICIEAERENGEIYYNVGVYPQLDEKLEKRIRALGYPYNYEKIRYYGTDNYEDAARQEHPLGIDIGGSWWNDYIADDAEVYEFAYDSLYGGGRKLLHRILYNPWRK